MWPSAGSPAFIQELQLNYGPGRSDLAYGVVVVAMFVVTVVGIGARVFGNGEQAALETMQARLELPGRTPATQVAGKAVPPRS
jgi:hypothetical protein